MTETAWYAFWLRDISNQKFDLFPSELLLNKVFWVLSCVETCFVSFSSTYYRVFRPVLIYFEELSGQLKTTFLYLSTLLAEMFGGEWFLAWNQGNHQNFEKKMIPHIKPKVFSLERNKTKNFVWKKNSKWPSQKNQPSFSKLPIINAFCENFMDWSLA